MREEQYICIDLHGLSVKQSKELINSQFALIKEKKIIEFNVITGRGKHVAPNGARGVLKKALPRILKPYCEEILEIDAEVGSYKIRLKRDSNALAAEFKTMLTLIVDSDRPDQQIAFLKEVEKRIALDDTQAMVLIANMHLIGEVKEFCNKETGINLLYRAQKLGSVEATTELGGLLIEGKHVKKNYKKGFKLLRKAAAENPIAQFWMAKFYILGQGVKQSDTEGLSWMQKSAAHGYPPAEFNLGYNYFHGNFTTENNDLAFKYFGLAASHGHIEAKSYLARCHACGYGTPQDIKQAFRLYK